MVEERIQAIAERQRHDGRGRVVGRLPATRRARPGGARQVRDGNKTATEAMRGVEYGLNGLTAKLVKALNAFCVFNR